MEIDGFHPLRELRSLRSPDIFGYVLKEDGEPDGAEQRDERRGVTKGTEGKTLNHQARASRTKNGKKKSQVKRESQFNESESQNGAQHEDFADGEVEHIQDAHQEGEGDCDEGIGATKHDAV